MATIKLPLCHSLVRFVILFGIMEVSSHQLPSLLRRTLAVFISIAVAFKQRTKAAFFNGFNHIVFYVAKAMNKKYSSRLKAMATDKSDLSLLK